MVPAFLLVPLALWAELKKANLADWVSLGDGGEFSMEVVETTIFFDAFFEDGAVCWRIELSFVGIRVSWETVFEVFAVFECLNKVGVGLDETSFQKVNDSLANRCHLQQAFDVCHSLRIFFSAFLCLSKELFVQWLVSVKLLIGAWDQGLSDAL